MKLYEYRTTTDDLHYSFHAKDDQEALKFAQEECRRKITKLAGIIEVRHVYDMTLGFFPII